MFMLLHISFTAVSLLFIYLTLVHLDTTVIGYCKNLISLLKIYPKNVTDDIGWSIFLYGYILAFFVCQRPPFLWFYPYVHFIAFWCTMFFFLRSEPSEVFDLYDDIYYMESWSFSYPYDYFSNDLSWQRYKIFRQYQWNILDNLDILITRICLICLVFCFFLI